MSDWRGAGRPLVLAVVVPLVLAGLFLFIWTGLHNARPLHGPAAVSRDQFMTSGYALTLVAFVLLTGRKLQDRERTIFLAIAPAMAILTWLLIVTNLTE